MSLIGRIMGFGRKASPIGMDGTTLADLRDDSGYGTRVTREEALRISTVLACVRVIANGVSQVPFRLYRQDGDARMIAKDHALNRLLHRRPNRWQTSFELREVLLAHVLLTGNAYAFVNRVGMAREISAIEPLDPNRVTVARSADLELTYTYTAESGATATFGADAIWHLRGPSWNSWMGMDALKAAATALGLAQALERGQYDFQKKGAQTSGVLSTKTKITPEKYAFLSAWLDKHMPGGERAGRPMILDDDAKYQSFTMSAGDQQLIETRKHQIEEICRHFGVMPIMVGHSDKTATYASAEQMFLAHVVHTLSPWYERIEQSADVNLLSPAEQEAGYFTKFTPNALMRGTAKERAEFYKAGLGSGGGAGWLTPNDVRRFEDMEPSDDPEADKLPRPGSQNAGAQSADQTSGDQNGSV